MRVASQVAASGALIGRGGSSPPSVTSNERQRPHKRTRCSPLPPHSANTSRGRTARSAARAEDRPRNAEDAVTEAASGNLLQRRARKPVAEIGGEPYTLWLRSLRPRNRVWGKPFMAADRRQEPPHDDLASSGFSRRWEPRGRVSSARSAGGRA